MCKKDGTNCSDSFSNLPDDIISNILSRLPTKCAVQTCVLSKAWKNNWTSIDNIDIHVEARHNLTFVEFINSILSNAQKVRSFRFSNYYSKEYGSHMEKWLSYVFTRNAEKIILKCYYTSIDLPRSLLSCTSLIELDMNMQCTWKTPVVSHFPNLAKLCLSYVQIMNENSTRDTLLFNFPVLKSFEMKRHQWLNVKCVEINAPALISFSSENMDGEENESYIINIIGTSLQNFETSGYYLEDFLLTGSTVSYAALKNYDPDTDDIIVQSGLRIRRILNEPSSLKSLELSCYLAQAFGITKSGPPLLRFYKLERLALISEGNYYFGGSVERAIEGLFELLSSAPVLKCLSIAGLSRLKLVYEDGYNSDMMQRPVPSCVVSHLEEVEIERYSGEIHEERDKHDFYLTKYFLENGAQLKKLYLCCDRIRKGDVIVQLSKISKPSSTAVKIIIT